jgi:hypothetical protein
MNNLCSFFELLPATSTVSLNISFLFCFFFISLFFDSILLFLVLVEEVLEALVAV